MSPPFGGLAPDDRANQRDVETRARDSFLDGSWDATGLLLEDFDQVRAVAARLPYVATAGF